MRMHYMFLTVGRSLYKVIVVASFLLAPLVAEAANVISITPSRNAHQVSTTSNVTVVFDAVIGSGNVSMNTFRVWGSQTGLIAGSYTGGGTNTIIFDPVRNFRLGEIISVTLTTGIGLTTSHSWQFTIASATVTANFVNRTPLTSPLNFPYSVFAADIDGDGDLDALSASSGDNKIAWYENDGSQNFTSHAISTTANGANAVFPADLDADGDIDVLSTSYNDDKIAWYENDGSENFTPRVVAIEPDPADVSAADLDGDGDLDVLASSSDTKWYENNGSGSFAPHVINVDGAYVLDAADVDSDGDMDVLSIFTGKISWYENDGFSNFTQHVISTNGGDSGHLTDLDGDGDVDALVGGSGSRVIWYENNGSQTFASRTILNSADLVYDVQAADIDGDADLDILVGKAGIAGVVRLDNDGSENFTVHTLTTAAIGVLSVHAADMDEDGDVDALSASFADGKIAWYTNNLPPVIADAVAGQGVHVGSTTLPFANLVLSDRDGMQPIDVIVQLDDAAKGNFTTTSLNAAGFANAGAGQYTFTGSGSDAQAALRLLAFSPATGRLTMGASETVGFTITADDGVSPITTDNVTTVIVTLVNIAPSFTRGSDVTLNEDAAIQSITGWASDLSAGPSTEAGQSLSFEVSNDNNTLFATQPDISASGTLTLTPAANAEGQATVTVLLKDNGGTASGGTDESATVTFTITINAVNDAPSFTKGTDINGFEDDGAQTIGGWAANISSGPASESAQTLNFEVTNDNNSLFALQPAIDASGTLTFTPAMNAFGEAIITVVLQDDGGTANGGAHESAITTFTVTLVEINDAPSFTRDVDVVVDEDAGTQAISAWASSIVAGPPNESSQALNFEVTNDNNILFAMQPDISTSGTLTFIPATNAFGQATVTVLLRDNAGLANGGVDGSDEVTFTITLNPVNDAPSFTKGADITGGEDDGAQTIGGWATNISAGVVNESTQTLGFVITNDNNELFSDQPSIDASGTLTFTPAANAFGEAIVTVVLKDDGGIANNGFDESASISFIITLDEINDAPTFTQAGDVVADEDAGTQTKSAWATNILAGPSNESGQALTFEVTNNNNTLFSVQPTIDPSGTLTFTPAPNNSGQATVAVLLKDNGGKVNGGADESATVTFSIIINAVNDVPSFTKGGDINAIEDNGLQTIEAWATNISPGPSDESTQLFDFVVTSNNNSLFSVQPAIDPAGTLTFTSVPNTFGQAVVTVVLKDDGGTINSGVNESVATTFTITLDGINDGPSFTKGNDIVVMEDAGAQTISGWATNILAGPSNESGQLLNFEVNNVDNALFRVQPAMSPSGTLTFTPAENASGQAFITVLLKDDGGTLNGGTDESVPVNFVITINGINDAPLVDAVPNVSVTVNSEPIFVSVTGIHPGSGEESQILTVEAFSDSHALLADPEATLSDDGTALLHLAPAQGVTGEATISVVLRDNGGTASGGQDETVFTFTLTISDVMQPLFIPTLFSPNGDGVNDVLRVRGAGIADIRFCLYTADGYEVFCTTDITTATENGWNGSYKGRDMPAGTYTWTLHGHFHDGSAFDSENKSHGQVILLR